ncbi:endonuclease/exonuclease/phosphatase family protein [Roseobacteraceae bacterium S113]
MRGFVVSVTIVAGALLGAGYLGALHPAGDSFAVFRAPLAVVFALFVIWTHWRWWLRWPLVALAMWALMSASWVQRDFGGPPSDYDFTLYQQNLRFNRSSTASWLAHIRARQPDMITLQEASRANRAILQDLSAEFGTQHYCDFGTVGGVAVLSRFPMGPSGAVCADRDGLAAIEVITPHGPVWLVSVHLHWPWPFGQAAQVDRLVSQVKALSGHVVIGGDFNAIGWAHAVSQFEKAISGARVRGDGASFTLPHIAMPVTIDHVLTSVSYDQFVQVEPRLGSDHKGLFAYLSRPRRD